MNKGRHGSYYRVFKIHTFDKSVYKIQSFADFFDRRPLLAQKNNHGSSHPCSRIYRMPGGYVSKIKYSYLRTDFRQLRIHSSNINNSQPDFTQLRVHDSRHDTGKENVKKKAKDLVYERSYKRLILLTRCHDKVKRCPVMLATFTATHSGKRPDSAMNTLYGLRLKLPKQHYGLLLDTSLHLPGFLWAHKLRSGNSQCMAGFPGSSTAQQPNVYRCRFKHRFANHTAVSTAGHTPAVLTTNMRVYLETVLLNKHEYVYR